MIVYNWVLIECYFMVLRIQFSFLLVCLAQFAFSTTPDSLIHHKALQSVSLQLGTTGPGLYYNRQISPAHRLTLRVGGQYVAYQKLIRVTAKSDSYINIQPDFAIAIAQASMKWHPFRKGTLFLVGGVGYTWHPSQRTEITTENKLKLDELVLMPEDVGTVNLGVRWPPVMGYFGWGFGRSIPKRRFGAGFEMGVYYLGKPRIELEYEGFLETTTLDKQIPTIERNIADYRYLLTINLMLSYRLTKK